MRMVHVPAGTFIMGSTVVQTEQVIQDCQDTYGSDGECRREICRGLQPAHSVSLESFWLDQTEVTNAMFSVFLNEQGNRSENGVYWFEPGAGHRGIVYGYIRELDGVFSTQRGYEDHPVIEVSWYGAAAYCEWAGGRLPTEAEWEYAARGPETNIFPWGDNFDGERTNYCDKLCAYKWRDTGTIDGASRWVAVGSYPLGASWVGALDMAGNVHEWVNDTWSEGDDLRVSRGGSWFDRSYRMSAVCRKGLTPSSARMHWVGFRCLIP
jgi:formylglycine-generating enzyme required for sulfatase activity